MKKVGLLILVLVIALGALGVGYAKWSDTVEISGTVITGNLVVGIADLGTIDDKIVDAIETDTTGSDPYFTPGHNTEGKNVASHTSSSVGTTIGSECENAYYEAVTETITNSYPWYASATTLSLANLGSIPVKIDDVRMVESSFSDPENLMAFMQVDDWILTYDNEDGTPALPIVGNGYEDLAENDSLQIPPHSCATLVINFHFIEEAEIDSEHEGLELMPMNATLSFDIVITASQWNEVP